MLELSGWTDVLAKLTYDRHLRKSLGVTHLQTVSQVDHPFYSSSFAPSAEFESRGSMDSAHHENLRQMHPSAYFTWSHCPCWLSCDPHWKPSFKLCIIDRWSLTGVEMPLQLGHTSAKMKLLLFLRLEAFESPGEFDFCFLAQRWSTTWCSSSWCLAVWCC